MAKEKVRVRFAPSPTGPLHIGGVRTALFNYLFAKQNAGNFILRIEDTDQDRYVDGAEDYIKKALDWCRIPFDEGPGKESSYGPYRQSERKEKYKSFAEKLVSSGNAYYAFDSPEDLEKLRQTHEEQGKTFIYNWHNRHTLQNGLSLSEEEIQQRLASGEPYVIRFKTPEEETLHFEDQIRGNMKVETKVLDDKVLFKSDGMPTYHLANVVDDHLMEITHVIRGEEWLPSLALHVLLYRGFGWNPPKFAHLPLILKPAGKGKLSKRDGEKLGFPVFPLQWKDPESGGISAGYREEGYFPEAVVNMLAHLGWNEGGGTEKELYTLPELVDSFSLEHVSKGGSRFDPDKAKWYQHHYMQEADDDFLKDGLNQILKKKKLNHPDEYLLKVISLLKERTTFLSDFWETGWYFFTPPEKYDQKAVKKAWKADTHELVDELVKKFRQIDDFTADKLQETTKAWIKSKDIGFGKIMQPFRLCLVGAMQGPDVFKIASILGKEETITRLKSATERLS